jgi:hypothetical protein
MTPTGIRPRRFFVRISPSLYTAAVIVAAFCLFCGSFAYVGANYEGQLRLLEPYRPPNADEAVVLIPVDYALNSNEANDVLFIGDSTCRCGVDSKRFTKLTGLTAYNLGTAGSTGIWGNYITLNLYLAHHPVPRAVVLCISPISLLVTKSQSGGGGNGEGGGGGGQTSAGSLYERFARAYGPPGSRKSVLADGSASLKYFINRGMSVTRVMPGAFAHGHFPDRLDDPLYGFSSETYRSLRAKTSESRGFFPLPKRQDNGVIVEELAEPHTIVPSMNEIVCDFAALAQSRSFRLIIRLAPMSREVGPWDHECLPVWVKKVEEQFPQVAFGRPLLLWYEPDACWDSIHVNSRGVERFTDSLSHDVIGIVGSRPAAGPRSK